MARPAASSIPRVLKTKWFAKAARNALIADPELCAAVVEVAKGHGSDLGGRVWKKRLNENRYRAIILTKSPRFWVYEFLFAKADSDNLSTAGLTAFRKIASDYAATLTDASVARLVNERGWKEICNAKADEAD